LPGLQGNNRAQERTRNHGPRETLISATAVNEAARRQVSRAARCASLNPVTDRQTRTRAVSSLNCMRLTTVRPRRAELGERIEEFSKAGEKKKGVKGCAVGRGNGAWLGLALRRHSVIPPCARVEGDQKKCSLCIQRSLDLAALLFES
jgi:hypothetical protein